jgi:hypothetical protein
MERSPMLMDWQINVLKMAILAKSIYMFNAVLIKIPMTLITETEKSTLNFISKHKRLWIDKAILSKKSNSGCITIPKFKLYYRVIVTKTAWYWNKNRHEDQMNRIEDADMNPRSYVHQIFDKVTQNIHWRKDSLFNKCCFENWTSACRKLKWSMSFIL